MPSSNSSCSSDDTFTFGTSNASSSTATTSIYAESTMGDDAPQPELGIPANHKRRKSVAFSAIETVIVERKAMNSPSAAEPCHKTPLSNSSNIPSESTGRRSNPRQSNNFVASSSCNRNSFEDFSLPPHHSQAPLETVSLLSRKRRFSVVSNSVPEMPLRHVSTQGPPADPSPDNDTLTDGNPLLKPKNIPASIPTTTSNRISNATDSTRPTSSFPADATRRVVSGHNSFDFSQHVQHRTYVVRTMKFSPMEKDECVVMLDACVDGLLPAAYPSLPPCSNDAVAIAPTERMSMGLFAQRAIQNLEVIIRERPVVITPYVIGLAVPLTQLYADIVRKLDPGMLERLMDLSAVNDKGNEGRAEAVDCEAMVRRNTLVISLSVPGEEHAEQATHRGIFVQTSKCNHNCGPNAKWEWDNATFSIVLSAVRPISGGEEITIAYVPPHLPYKERAAQLRELYAFACRCAHCMQPAPIREKSDAARALLCALWDPAATPLPTFERWCADPALPHDMLLRAHISAVEMIRREGLHVLDSRAGAGSAGAGVTERERERAVHPQRDLGRHLDAIATCYGALADVENFRRWAQMALDAREGGRAEDKIAFKKWLSNPVSFPVWGKKLLPAVDGAVAPVAEGVTAAKAKAGAKAPGDKTTTDSK